MHPLLALLIWFLIGTVFAPLYWVLVYWDEGKIEIKGEHVPFILMGICVGPMNMLFIMFPLIGIAHEKYKDKVLFKVDKEDGHNRNKRNDTKGRFTGPKNHTVRL